MESKIKPSLNVEDLRSKAMRELFISTLEELDINKRLENLENLILKEREVSETNEINNFEKVWTELKNFPTLYGYSVVLKTKNPIIKTFWVVLGIILAAVLGCNVSENVTNYLKFHTITDIRIAPNKSLILPSVSICLYHINEQIDIKLENFLIDCYFDSVKCKSSDFEAYKLKKTFLTQDYIFYYDCYKLNGGKNLTGHSNKIKSSNKIGSESGFYFHLLLDYEVLCNYYIGDTFYYPTEDELTEWLVYGSFSNIVLKRYDENKLGEPYNQCVKNVENENSHESFLFKKIIRSGRKYRQVNCLDMCKRNFISEKNISEKNANYLTEVLNFDTEKYCPVNLCPLECDTVSYDLSKSLMYYNEVYHKIALENYKNLTQIILGLNLTLKEISRRLVGVYIYYDKLSFTKISQIPKTSPWDLVSSLGGSFGVFLELGFISVCRFLEFFLIVILKL